MPIKWTAEVDQVLLLKILETSQINADVKAISEAWPKGMEKPTPRAITERLVKIRGNAKDAGASAHFSVSNSKTGTPNGTPRKRAPNGTPKKNGNGIAKAGGSAKKRKRGGNMSDDEASDDQQTAFKTENNDTDADDDVAPTKAKKTKEKKRRNKVKLEDSEGEEQNDAVDHGDEQMLAEDNDNEEAVVFM